MSKSLAVVTVGIALTLWLCLPVAAVSTEYTSAVRNGCQSLVNVLDELQRRDLVSRINRGRAYQDITDQMQALNTRVHSSSFSATDLDSNYAKVSAAVDSFRSLYTRYDDIVTSLKKISCVDKTDSFIAVLNQARTARSAVGDATTNIDGAMADYRQAVSVLQARLSNGGVQ